MSRTVREGKSIMVIKVHMTSDPLHPRGLSMTLPQPDMDQDRRRLAAFKGQAHQHMQAWRLLIVTSHRPYANLLSLELGGRNPHPPLLPQRLLAICDTASAVREALPSDSSDVLIFFDESLRDDPVLPLIEELRRRNTPPKIVLAMAAPVQPALVRAAWRADVSALVCSDDFGNGELTRALIALSKGERYCGPTLTEFLQSEGTASDALSRRELEVLPLVADGLTNRQIAARLQIAEVTARDHVQRILQKLQVSDRAAAAALAVRLGLVR
jgi:DNA-binding NarL/FixJ family response regulator